nr:hypothetical protein [Tanacetum cinerariifolium]
MSNRSSARNLFPPLDNLELTIRRRSRVDPTLLNNFEMATEGNGDPPVPDLRTMKELCQPTLNGQGGPIALIAIQAMNFGLKNDMIQQDTSAQRSESSSSITSSSDLEIIALKAEMAEINKNLMKVLQPPLAKLRTYMLREPTKVVILTTWLSLIWLLQEQLFMDIMGKSGPSGQGRNQFFQGASHGPNPPPAYQAPAYQASGYQAPVHQPPIPQPQVMTTTEFTNYMKANDAILKNMQTNITSLKNSNLELKNMFGQFMKMNTASSSGSGTLPSNTVTNPTEDLKVERETEVTKDTVPPTNNESTKDVQPLVVQVETPVLNYESIVAPVAEPVVAPVSDPKPNPKPSIPYPSRLHDQKLRDKGNDQKEKFFQIFKNLNFNISFADALTLMPKLGPTIKSLLTNKDKLFELARTSLNEHSSTVLLKKLPESCGTLVTVTFNLDQTSRYSANYNDITANRIDVIDMACEEYSHEVFGFSDVIASGNPTPYYDPIVFTSFPTLPPFGDSDFLLEEVDAFLALKDDPTSPEVYHSYYDMEGDILLLEAFINDDPSLPLPTQGMYLPQI